MGRVDALDNEWGSFDASSPISKRSGLPVVTLVVKIPFLGVRDEHLRREPREIEQSGNFGLGTVEIRLRPVEVIPFDDNRLGQNLC